MHKISCSKFDKGAIGTANFKMGETVMDLIPNSTYRFDMYVSKGDDSVQLGYRSIWIRTKAGCKKE